MARGRKRKTDPSESNEQKKTEEKKSDVVAAGNVLRNMRRSARTQTNINYQDQISEDGSEGRDDHKRQKLKADKKISQGNNPEKVKKIKKKQEKPCVTMINEDLNSDSAFETESLHFRNNSISPVILKSRQAACKRKSKPTVDNSDHGKLDPDISAKKMKPQSKSGMLALKMKGEDVKPKSKIKSSNNITLSKSKQRAKRPTQKSRSTVLKRQDRPDVETKITAQTSSSATLESLTHSDNKASLDKEKEDSDDSGSDWEDVADMPVFSDSASKVDSPKKAIQITIEEPDKKKGSTAYPFDWFRQALNRIRKENQLNAHKTHLLCLLSVLTRRNQLCRQPALQAIALSVVPARLLKIKSWTKKSLVSLCEWYRETFTITTEIIHTPENRLGVALMSQPQSKQSGSPLEFIMVLVSLVRALGLSARFIVNLQPITTKAPDLIPKPKGDQSWRFNSNYKESLCKRHPKVRFKYYGKPPSKRKDGDGKTDAGSTIDLTTDIPQVDGSSDDRLESENSTTRSKRNSGKVNYAECDGEEDQKTNKNKAKRNKKSADDYGLSSESDFKEDLTSYRTPVKNKRQKNPSGSRAKTKKNLTKDSENGVVEWMEVYLESEKQWIVINSVNADICALDEMEGHAAKPISYILAFDNDGGVKDVTRKYCSNFHTENRKLRLVEKWWNETLIPYTPSDKKENYVDDKRMADDLAQKPLPTSVAEYKSHPLYALKRHLLKYEGIYPEAAIPSGYIKGEPVYSRDCVRTLHTRETWIKEGKSVKVGEVAYKQVKGKINPKRRKMSPVPLEDPIIDLFGEWQVEDYISPPAKDGIVPRNEYGKVEMFKPTMLPAGTLHIRGHTRLDSTAKKIGVDCAPALIGWDFQRGHCIPLVDGWVVCVEHVEILTAAWEEEQAIIMQREYEKREKRVIANWIKLIRGLKIKEKIQKKYPTEIQEVEEALTQIKKQEEINDEESNTNGEEATDVAVSWPSNRQQKTKKPAAKKVRGKKKKDVTLFPFETEEL